MWVGTFLASYFARCLEKFAGMAWFFFEASVGMGFSLRGWMVDESVWVLTCIWSSRGSSEDVLQFSAMSWCIQLGEPFPSKEESDCFCLVHEGFCTSPRVCACEVQTSSGQVCGHMTRQIIFRLVTSTYLLPHALMFCGLPTSIYPARHIRVYRYHEGQRWGLNAACADIDA